MHRMSEFACKPGSLIWLLLSLLVACCSSCFAHQGARESDEWLTKRHRQGWCAMYGVCADRKDGGSLNCPSNIPAPPAEKEAANIMQTLCPDLWESSGGNLCCSGEQAGLMHQQLRRAEPFIIGCPACLYNFRNLFCSLFCSPDQATFTNITSVQQASRKESRAVNVTAVEEVSFYLSEAFKSDTYDSCKDVIFGSANSRAMTYIGNNALKAQDFFDFIGTVKDRNPFHIGSPFQINFEPGDPEEVPKPIIPLHEHLPTCWDSVLKCSCGDCPDAPTCSSHTPAVPPAKHGCILGSIGSFTVYCSNLFALAVLIAMLPALSWAYASGKLGTDKEVIDTHAEGDRSRSPSPVRSVPTSSPQEGTAREYLIPPGTRRSSYFQSDDDEDPETVPSQPLSLPLSMQPVFAWIGKVVASSPRLTILICICFTSLCTLGLLDVYVDTDPFSLWAPPHSRSARDKNSYDEAFGPFYRIEQLILSTVPEKSVPKPILKKENIEFVFDIHHMVDAISVETYDGDDVTLQTICYKPFGQACAIESVAQYWQMDRSKYDSQHVSLQQCLSHWPIDCRSTFEAPIEPKMVLGGYPYNTTDYIADTTALLITLPVDNNQSMSHKILLWEAEFLAVVEEQIVPKAKKLGLSVSWSAESSIQQELFRESFLDITTVAVSYAAMLVYIGLALGRFSGKSQSCAERMVSSRVLLGLGGVVVVMCSVVGGLGLCSAMGVSASLIVMEVVPFLVLAIGVDNMFLIAAEEELQQQDLPVEQRIANALGSVGPSITMSTICEVLAFLAAALTQVPAVRHFAFVAAASVALDYFLQITAFVAFLTLDCQRMERGYADVVPCLQLLPPINESDVPNYQVEGESGDEEQMDSPTYEDDIVLAAKRSGESRTGVQAVISGALGWLHSTVLSTERGKLAVLVLAVLFNAAALVSLSHISIGLDQQVALPRDSYLQRYYRDVMEHARVGPPVMFVVEGMNLSSDSPDIDAISGCASCNTDSLVNTISQAAQNPGNSHIASPAASWIDDFLAWIQPELPNCCRVHTDGADEGAFCPAPDVPPCSHFHDPCADCNTCLRASDLDMGRPSTEKTLELLPGFLQAKPSKLCAKGGLGVYSALFELDEADGLPVGLPDATVTSAFRALSSPLSKQKDFISALLAGRHIVDSVQRALNAAHQDTDTGPPRVYMYSIFHPFFEQFVSIVSESVAVLVLACTLVLLVSFIFTGSVWLSTILGLTLASLLLDIAGLLPLCGVQLNAVSLVNMSMCAGIGLEFIAHIAHAFMRATGTREERSATALAGKGAAVCSGIILTKLVGVTMLAFSRTQIFAVYYFRMYMALVVVGSFHSLLLLPVILSLIGPQQEEPLITSGNAREEANQSAPPQMYVQRARVLISRKDPSTGSNSCVGDAQEDFSAVAS